MVEKKACVGLLTCIVAFLEIWTFCWRTAWVWKYLHKVASVPQGHWAAWWQAAGDEPHAPRRPAGSLQRSPGCAETHGAQLVCAASPPTHTLGREVSLVQKFVCSCSDEFIVFKISDIFIKNIFPYNWIYWGDAGLHVSGAQFHNTSLHCVFINFKYLEIYFSNSEQWHNFLKTINFLKKCICIQSADIKEAPCDMSEPTFMELMKSSCTILIRDYNFARFNYSA